MPLDSNSPQFTDELTSKIAEVVRQMLQSADAEDGVRSQKEADFVDAHVDSIEVKEEVDVPDLHEYFSTIIVDCVAYGIRNPNRVQNEELNRIIKVEERGNSIVFTSDDNEKFAVQFTVKKV